MKKYNGEETNEYTKIFGQLINFHDLYMTSKREIKPQERKEIQELLKNIENVPEELKIKKFKQMLGELEKEYQKK